MSEITLVSKNDQISFEYLKGMTDRMEMAFYSYGDYKNNYRGRYSRAFLKDLNDTIGALMGRWKDDKGTTANANAILSGFKRLLLYTAGGETRGGIVKPGNREYVLDYGNFVGIEYAFPQVPKAWFEAGDSSTSPGLHGEGEGEVSVAADALYRGKSGD